MAVAWGIRVSGLQHAADVSGIDDYVTVWKLNIPKFTCARKAL
jgi:hypothetical protein